jgi:hypothetical protein
MVGIVAAQLWGGSGSEPAPKTEGTGNLFRTRKAEDSPPEPLLSIPRECEVAYRPPRAPLAPGAPVSVRGLAIRRQQERGIDAVYG